MIRQKAHVLGEGISGKAAKNFLTSKGYRFCDQDPDLVIVSPGIPLTDSECQKWISAGKEVIGEMELGLRFIDRPAVGVTGTNGKTSVVTWTAQMVGGVACGNNGYALTQALLETDRPLIIEMSSYQLETAKTQALDGAVILNIAPDHLDRYKTFEDYRRAKERIIHCLKEGAPLWRNLEVEQAVRHLSGLFGVEAILPFNGLEHRYEILDGPIVAINDSKATNMAAVAYALSKTKPGIFLLLGGQYKQDGMDIIREYAYKVKKVFAFGSAAHLIVNALNGDFNIEKIDTLKQATKKAFKEAMNGDTILLSPGCASFDQFSNFQQRGKLFKDYCRECRYES